MIKIAFRLLELSVANSSTLLFLLWPPYVMGPLYFCPVVSFFLVSSFLFSSPILSGRRLDVCHTSTHGVALVRIYNAGLKCAACGSLQIQDTNKNSSGDEIANVNFFYNIAHVEASTYAH